MPDAEQSLKPDQCRTVADLDRLDPKSYAELVSRPATMLDLIRLQLQTADAIRALGGK